MRYLFLLLLLLGFLVNCNDSTNPDKPDGAKDKTEAGKETTKNTESTEKENSVAMNNRSSENNEAKKNTTIEDYNNEPEYCDSDSVTQQLRMLGMRKSSKEASVAHANYLFSRQCQFSTAVGIVKELYGNVNKDLPMVECVAMNLKPILSYSNQIKFYDFKRVDYSKEEAEKRKIDGRAVRLYYSFNDDGAQRYMEIKYRGKTKDNRVSCIDSITDPNKK